MDTSSNINQEFKKLINQLDVDVLSSIVTNFVEKEDIRAFLINTLPEPYKEEVLDNLKHLKM